MSGAGTLLQGLPNWRKQEAKHQSETLAAKLCVTKDTGVGQPPGERSARSGVTWAGYWHSLNIPTLSCTSSFAPGLQCAHFYFPAVLVRRNCSLEFTTLGSERPVL